MKSSGRFVLGVLAFGALFAAGAPTSAHRSDGPLCRDVKGLTSSVMEAPPACRSPVGMCTNGVNTGDFAGTYHFVMATQVMDPESQTLLRFTGHSAIVPDEGHGKLISDDRGTISFTSPTQADFVNYIHAARGTGTWAHATVDLTVVGVLDLTTGTVAADYEGTLCTHAGDGDTDHDAGDTDHDSRHDGDHDTGHDHDHD